LPFPDLTVALTIDITTTKTTATANTTATASTTTTTTTYYYFYHYSAGPRALDGEDEDFFNSLHETQSKKKEIREQTERRELATFRDAVSKTRVAAEDKDNVAPTKFKIAQKEASIKPVVAAPGKKHFCVGYMLCVLGVCKYSH
jgi:hypothetical protein